MKLCQKMYFLWLLLFALLWSIMLCSLMHTLTCIFVDIVHRDLKLENILLAVDPNNLEDKLYIKVGTLWIDKKCRKYMYQNSNENSCEVSLL